MGSLADNLQDNKGDVSKDVTADNTSPYYNICSPCIRHNDFCKSVRISYPASGGLCISDNFADVCLAGQGL